jgi:hypothetical protein
MPYQPPRPASNITHYPRRSPVTGWFVVSVQNNYATLCGTHNYVPAKQIRLEQGVTCLACIALMAWRSDALPTS